MRAEKRWCVGLSAILLLLILPASALAQIQPRIGVLVFGASYHYQSRTYEDASETKKYEQWNYGAGLEYVIHDGRRNLFTVDGGVYRDSKDNANIFGGLLWRFKFTERLSAGVGVTLLTSPIYPPIAPLPVVTYRLNRVSINAVWLPSLGDDSGAVGFFATLHLWRPK